LEVPLKTESIPADVLEHARKNIPGFNLLKSEEAQAAAIKDYWSNIRFRHGGQIFIKSLGG